MNQILFFSVAGRPLSVPSCDRGAGTLPRITASILRAGAGRRSQWHQNGWDLVHDTGSDLRGQHFASRSVAFLGKGSVEGKGVLSSGNSSITASSDPRSKGNAPNSWK